MMMKRHLREMDPSEKKEWRRWQTWSICLYTIIAAAMLGIGWLLPAPGGAELAQSVPVDQISSSKQPGMSTRAGIR